MTLLNILQIPFGTCFHLQGSFILISGLFQTFCASDPLFLGHNRTIQFSLQFT
ncbi:hypothetical protein D3C74_448390 [compost metagenome]